MFFAKLDKGTKFIAIGLFITLVAWMWGCRNVKTITAQSDVLWSEPIQLSDLGVDAWAPTIVADKSGHVHVVWSQTMTDRAQGGQGDTLFYARWDGQEWTPPVDVLVSPMGVAEWPDLAITPDGMLHLVWGTAGQDSQLLYAQAPACCADGPAHWTKPMALYWPILATPAIVADGSGRLHVAYSSQETGSVMYQHSDDGGSTWSRPASLFSETRQLDEYTIWPRLAVDARARVHLVWTVMPWPGRAAAYARSDDGGTTWNEPQVIDIADREDYESDAYGPIYIDVEAHGMDEVHVIWDGAPTIERTHLWSSDGGETWSTTSLLFPEVSRVGRAGWNDMVFDSNNVLHAVSMIAVGSPLHATWNGFRWSATDRVATIGPATSGTHHTRLTVSRGNTLHVVWQKKDDQPFTVWYARGQSSAPELAVQALPTLAPEPTATKIKANPTPSSPTPLPTLSPQQSLENKSVQPSILANPLFALLGGMLPALLLVSIIFLAVSWQRHGQRRGWREPKK